MVTTIFPTHNSYHHLSSGTSSALPFHSFTHSPTHCFFTVIFMANRYTTTLFLRTSRSSPLFTPHPTPTLIKSLSPPLHHFFQIVTAFSYHHLFSFFHLYILFRSSDLFSFLSFSLSFCDLPPPPLTQLTLSHSFLCYILSLSLSSYLLNISILFCN